MKHVTAVLCDVIGKQIQSNVLNDGPNLSEIRAFFIDEPVCENLNAVIRVSHAT